MTEDRYLSRSIDHLGEIGARLRDLRGFRTLIHELIQNADDAPGASQMTIDIADDGLTVDNDGHFRNCGHLEQNDCPWKSSEQGHSCDFHRLRRIGAGDKRKEIGTIGAFGIGFLSVYQITDRPNVIANGQHWTFFEENDEARRIRVCSGCQKCLPASNQTRFFLPWALDTKSPIRKALTAQAVSEADISDFKTELPNIISIAILFLRHISQISVKVSGRAVTKLERIEESDQILISDSAKKTTQLFLRLNSDFSSEAHDIRLKHVGLVEAKRSASVSVTVPKDESIDGLLCAFLPTEQRTGLPFHINADFFPTSDRKRIIFSVDYQSEWNRAALAAAARLVGEHLMEIRDLFGNGPQVWKFLSAVERSSKLETLYQPMWEALNDRVRLLPLIENESSNWFRPTDIRLLQSAEESFSLSTLQKLGITIASEQLRPYHNLLRAVGVKPLDTDLLCNHLIRCGITERWTPSEGRFQLSDTDVRVLWREFSILLKRADSRSSAETLKTLALARNQRGEYVPCAVALVTDVATQGIMAELGIIASFLEADEDFNSLLPNCPVFDAPAAIDALSISRSRIESSIEKDAATLERLFAWLEDRRHEILASNPAKEKLLGLPIFPSNSGLGTAHALVLPGDFTDPIGIADLMNADRIGGRHDFLRDIGVRQLDFETYVVTSVPSALESPTLEDNRRRATIELLTERYGVIVGIPGAADALKTVRLIECIDGQFRSGPQCYFASQTVDDVLGPINEIAVPNDVNEALRTFQSFLGVAEKPRLEHVVKRIFDLVSVAPEINSIQSIRSVIRYLSAELANSNPLSVDIRSLQSIAWLPAKDDESRWFEPDEIYATFREYLFSSQAHFLDLSPSDQGRSFLDYFSIKDAPTVGQVVDHLLFSAENLIRVNSEVYTFLEQHSEDPEIAELLGKKCLLVGNLYISPQQAFWGEHHFGRYREHLSADLRSFTDLFTRLGVKDTPNYSDAVSVLIEIGDEFGSENTQLDTESRAVVTSCWDLIESDESDKELNDRVGPLRSRKCVLNVDDILVVPGNMFFDNRADLARTFSDFLRGNLTSIPTKGGRAMLAAGVRLLGDAVQRRILQCEDAFEDEQLAKTVRDRAQSLRRVLHSQIQTKDLNRLESQLRSITFFIAQALSGEDVLSAFHQTIRADTGQLSAYYNHNERSLFVVPMDQSRQNWALVSKELAIALFPKKEPGPIALAIREVLACSTSVEADTMLDDLGFPRIVEAQEFPASTPTDTNRLNSFVGEEYEVTQLTRPDNRTITRAEEDVDTVSLVSSSTCTDATSAPISNSSDAPDTSVDSASSDEERVERRDRRAQPVLRSYLPAPDSGITEDDEVSTRSIEIGEAGVKRVIEYEIAQGRHPRVMDHFNPGYDVESYDDDGNVVRYIECKTKEVEWSGNYAAITSRQFRTALKLGDRFWLYVVERPSLETYAVHAIANPIERSTRFLFDDGWKDFSEAHDMS